MCNKFQGGNRGRGDSGGEVVCSHLLAPRKGPSWTGLTSVASILTALLGWFNFPFRRFTSDNLCSKNNCEMKNFYHYRSNIEPFSSSVAIDILSVFCGISDDFDTSLFFGNSTQLYYLLAFSWILLKLVTLL